jgi:hypothetical protein
MSEAWRPGNDFLDHKKLHQEDWSFGRLSDARLRHLAVLD